MKKPNLFIVGSPKCGTTALSEYLREHPNIYMSEPKEPHYFAIDIPKYRTIKTEDEYYNIFDKSTDKHKIIGEASVFYMYSKVAINNIKRFNPDAKIIVMLRNPVQVAYSMHSQLLYTKDEDVSDFIKAWELIDKRKQGFNVPKFCRDRKVLYYDEIAKYSNQLSRLFNVFPNKQIKIIFFDDFIKDTCSVYKDVLRFLELEDDNRLSFSKINENKRHNLDFVSNFTQRPPQFIRSMVKPLKIIPGLKDSLLFIMEGIRSINSIKGARQPLSNDIKMEMIEVYRDDIIALSDITDRDLHHWLY